MEIILHKKPSIDGFNIVSNRVMLSNHIYSVQRIPESNKQDSEIPSCGINKIDGQNKYDNLGSFI